MILWLESDAALRRYSALKYKICVNITTAFSSTLAVCHSQSCYKPSTIVVSTPIGVVDCYKQNVTLGPVFFAIIVHCVEDGMVQQEGSELL